MCKPTLATPSSSPIGGKDAFKGVQTIVNNQQINGDFDKDTKLQNAKENLRKGTLYACISLIMLISAFSLTMPYLQSRRDELECDTLCQGSMMSARSTLALIGSAFMGRLSDSKGKQQQQQQQNSNSSRYKKFCTFFGLDNGRILCLYIGTLATFIGFIINASIYSIKGMWMGMIPGALLQQNFSIYKAMLADYHEEITQLEEEVEAGKTKEVVLETTNEEGVQTIVINDDGEKDSLLASSASKSAISTSSNKDKIAGAARSGSVGQLGMSVGIAFMVGPLFGALIVKTYQGAVIVANCLTILSTIWIMKMPIPSSSVYLSSSSSSSNINNTMENNEKEKDHLARNNILSSSWWKLKFMKLINVSKPALFLIVIRLSMALAFHIFNTIWTVSLKRRFDFGPSDHGKFMSFIGLVYALSQGFIAKRILTRFGTGESRIQVILICCVTLGVGRIVAFQVNDLKVVYVMFGFIVTSLGVVNTILTADTSLIAPSSEIGGIYGILEAAQSAAGMVGPFVGGVLARIDPVNAPLASIVGLYLLVFILVLVGYEKLILRQSSTEDGKGETNGTEIKKKL